MVKPLAKKLLSGGNPQIAIGDGDAPVQAYIAAMPGWKRAVGERLDARHQVHQGGVFQRLVAPACSARNVQE
jgi:hypothetical protein